MKDIKALYHNQVHIFNLIVLVYKGFFQMFYESEFRYQLDMKIFSDI